MDKIGLSIEEVVEVSGLSRTTIFELIKAGELASVKVGRRRIIPASEVKNYFDRLTTAAQQRPAGASNA